MEAVDPWYDYLALPGAPLILLLQGLAFCFRRRVRRLIAGVGTALIATMFVFVAFLLPLPEGDPGIGAGLMFFWLIGSLLLLGATLIPQRAEHSRA